MSSRPEPLLPPGPGAAALRTVQRGSAPEAPAGGTAAEPSLGARPLTVLLVDPSLFTAPYDAALTAGLVEAGVSPVWATRPVRQGDRQEIPAPYVDDFFYRRVDEGLSLPGPLRMFVKGLAHAWGLLVLLARARRLRPDIVHIQWIVIPPLDVLAMLALKRISRVVLTAHDTVPFNGMRVSWIQRQGFDLPLRIADAVIVHTRGGRERLLARGLPAGKLSVIPHGPLSLHERVPAAATRTDPRWTFVLFGELKPYKGVDLLVEAFGRLPAPARARMRLVVAGRPRMDLAPILARRRELGLDDTIEIRAQRQTEPQLAELLGAADCFVFPYRQIDASGAYYLVKSLGRWIIASAVGIFREDLRDGIDGRLIDSESVEALSQALLEAADGRRVPDAPSGDAAWPAIGRATRGLYEALLAGPGSAAADAASPARRDHGQA